MSIKLSACQIVTISNVKCYQSVQINLAHRLCTDFQYSSVCLGWDKCTYSFNLMGGTSSILRTFSVGPVKKHSVEMAIEMRKNNSEGAGTCKRNGHVINLDFAGVMETSTKSWMSKIFQISNWLLFQMYPHQNQRASKLLPTNGTVFRYTHGMLAIKRGASKTNFRSNMGFCPNWLDPALLTT